MTKPSERKKSNVADRTFNRSPSSPTAESVRLATETNEPARNRADVEQRRLVKDRTSIDQADCARLGKATRVRSEKKDARWWTDKRDNGVGKREEEGRRGQRRERERVEWSKRRFAVGCGKRQ